jgi:formate--tetrahydrofolate ligase
VTPAPIEAVAAELGLAPGEVEPWGRGVAKVDAERVLARAPGRGRLVLVTAITPTAHGEGKTTVLLGLVQALRRLGARPLAAVRQPTLGPVFGLKGGGNGGGASQVVPRDRFDLHLTGDSHAVQAAHNLAAAFLDEQLHRGGPLAIDPATVTWPRVLDLCDRALRGTVVGLGPAAGPPRQVAWHITAASEVMAVLALARDLSDLRARLGRIVVARRRRDAGGGEVTLEALRVAGPMAALLRDAARPNLLQTTEGAPVLAHAGPFANVAHGCSSVLADRVGLALADWVVTEAGFGAELGAEKFFDITCRQAGFSCACAVVVATVRALVAHGRSGGAADEATALRLGAANLARQVQNVRRFGVPVVVAVNAFEGDQPGALAAVVEAGLEAGAVAAAPCWPFSRGGAGCEELARDVLEAGARPVAPALLYPDDRPLLAKLEAIATAMYGAEGVDLEPAAARALERLEADGHGRLQVCVAKTHLALGHDPARGGWPTPSRLPVRELLLRAGAGFVTAVAGEVSLMPALPARPRGEGIDLGPDGEIQGL